MIKGACAGGIEMIILLYQNSLIIYSWIDTLPQLKQSTPGAEIEEEREKGGIGRQRTGADIKMLANTIYKYLHVS